MIAPCPSGHKDGLNIQAWPIMVSHLLGNGDWSTGWTHMTGSGPVRILHWMYIHGNYMRKALFFLLEMLNWEYMNPELLVAIFYRMVRTACRKL